MNIFKSFILVSFMTILTGCVPNYAVMPADDVAKKITIKDSEFDSSINYVAPTLFNSKQRGLLTGYDYENFSLRGWKSKSGGNVTHQLYIDIKYSSKWRYYQSASFENGKQQDLTIINREVVRCESYGSIGVLCDYRETFGISFTNEALNSLKETGFKVRGNSQSGHENILTVPANYIQGYLKAIS